MPDMDLGGPSPHCDGMRERSGGKPTNELIQRMLLEAGRLMEDESPELPLIVPREPRLIVPRVDRLHRIATDILALASAAQVLVRSIGEDAGRD